MRLEVQAKTQQKSPMKAILGVTGVLVIIAGGLGFKMYSDHQAELAAQRANLARVEAEARAQKAESEARLAQIQKDMDAKLSKAQTEAERAQIRAEAAAARAAASRPGSHHTAAKSEEKPAAAPVRKVADKKTISDNPLEGL
jgi:hypothetical protein